jgi:cytochrome b6-f complex iron-sulfur subunit
MERRSFLTYFGVSWAASCFPLVLSASANAAKERRQEMTVAQLDKDGSVKDGKVLVIRDPADETKLLAVNNTCTHNGCAVQWEAKEKSFVCPCHGAKFAADGTVQNGPAKKPLKTYKAKIVGRKIVVKTS